MTNSFADAERTGQRVAVIGAGAAGLAAYALLDQRGHAPIVFSPSGASTRVFIEGEQLRVIGAIEATIRPTVALSMAEAVEGAEAVLIALPANGHRAIFKALAPLLVEGQTVIISAHAAFGALYLNKLLTQRDLRVPIVVWSRTILRSRRPEPTLLRISNLRGSDLAGLPTKACATGLSLCTELFGDRFKPCDTLLQTSLANMNPHSHLALALSNITRMERGEDWAQHEMQTPAVCNLLEALDSERAAIADAFGLTAPSSQQNYAANLGAEAPLSELAAMLFKREQENGVVTYGPKTLNSRYVLEDMPFGVTTTLALAKMTGRAAPLHAAGLALMSVFYARDFGSENDILAQLHLEALSPEAFADLCRQGFGGEGAR